MNCLVVADTVKLLVFLSSSWGLKIEYRRDFRHTDMNFALSFAFRALALFN